MPSGTTLFSPTRVLLVDDSEAILARAAAALTEECEIVGAVTDGLAALAAAKSLQPDVVVLDISMPGISGFEVASRLSKAGVTAAIVFLTVQDGEEFVLTAKLSSAIGYVVKTRLVSDLPVAVREARAGRPFVSAL
jgi:DNA-binding NarL/FixJ family response regulator